MTCNNRDLPWDIVTETDSHSVRVGACPVLSVRVRYPQLIRREGYVGAAAEPTDAAVARFNDTYRTAAEQFMAWGLGTPTVKATAAFEAMGVDAVYRFARWELTMDATPVWDGDSTFLRVKTTAVWQVRREADARGERQLTDVWHWPSLHREKNREKTVKVEQNS